MLGTTLAATLKGQVLPIPGGVLIRDGAGRLLGAMAAAGDAPDNDESAAPGKSAKAAASGERFHAAANTRCSIPSASATASWVRLPSCTLSPRARPVSSASAFCHPRSAIDLT